MLIEKEITLATYCDMCGLCCKNIPTIPETRAYDLGNGVCKYLSIDNKCMIYKERPNLCNADWVYNNMFGNYTKEHFLEILIEICEKLKQIEKSKNL